MSGESSSFTALTPDEYLKERVELQDGCLSTKRDALSLGLRHDGVNSRHRSGYSAGADQP